MNPRGHDHRTEAHPGTDARSPASDATHPRTQQVRTPITGRSTATAVPWSTYPGPAAAAPGAAGAADLTSESFEAMAGLGTPPDQFSPEDGAARGDSDGHGESDSDSDGGYVGADRERDVTAWVRREVSNRLSARARSGRRSEGGGDGPDSSSGGDAGWDGLVSPEAGWDLIGEVLDEYAASALGGAGTLLPAAVEARVARTVFNSLFGLGGLSPLLEDPQVENIDINGFDHVWVRSADGSLRQAAPIADSDEEMVDLIRTLAARSGAQERRFDRGSPTLNLQLPDGSRMFAVMAVSHRPSVSIRRHRYLSTTLDQLEDLGTVDAGLRDLLTALVLAKKNILVAGGTNLGKTTLLRALAAAIPPQERLITIEDTYELGLHHDRAAHPNVVALQAREANIEAQGEVTQSDLVRSALRMSPDRVIVGEIRGQEVIPMFNAMSQGNDGSMTSLHASSSQVVFSRLASYAYQSPERLPLEATTMLVANAVHVIVHLGWARTSRPHHPAEQAAQQTGRDGEGRGGARGRVRAVSSVREVVGADGLMVVSNEIYRPDPSGRAVPGVPLRPQTLEDLLDVGFDDTLLRRPEGWWSR